MALEGPGYFWFGLLTWTLSGLFGTFMLAWWIHERATRVLGMVVALTGIGSSIFYLGLLEQSPEWGAYWGRVVPYFLIGPTFLWVYFISVYPRSRFFATAWWLKLSLLALAALPMIAYARDKALWGSHDGPGPLFVFESGLFFGGALLASVLANDFRRSPPGPNRRSQFLLAVGFATFASVHGPEHLVTAWPGRGTTDVGWLVWGVAVVTVSLLVVFWATLAREAWRPESELRTRFGLFAAAPLGATGVGTTIGLVTRSDLSPGVIAATHVILDSATCLIFILLIVYSQAKYRLFNVDLRIKWTLNRGTIAAAFVAVFFLVSEFAKSVFETTVGPVLGLLAAGLLMFGLAPLQRFADRWTEAAMPRVDRSGDYLTYRKLQMYRAAYESALEEGGVTPKERQSLARLAQKLGIAPADRNALEQEVAEISGTTM